MLLKGGLMQNNLILIIDDEKVIIEILKETLEGMGYEVIFAFNGQEGVELFEKRHPIVVILDLKMPIMDGVKFLSSINLSPSAHFTVIVLTGHEEDKDILKCFNAGVKFKT